MLLLVAGAIVRHPENIGGSGLLCPSHRSYYKHFLQVRGLTKGERSLGKWHLNVAMASGHSKASCCTGAADYMDILGASRRVWGLIDGCCLKIVCVFMLHVPTAAVGGNSVLLFSQHI